MVGRKEKSGRCDDIVSYSHVVPILLRMWGGGEAEDGLNMKAENLFN